MQKLLFKIRFAFRLVAVNLAFLNWIIESNWVELFWVGNSNLYLICELNGFCARLQKYFLFPSVACWIRTRHIIFNHIASKILTYIHDIINEKLLFIIINYFLCHNIIITEISLTNWFVNKYKYKLEL